MHIEFQNNRKLAGLESTWSQREDM